MKMTEKKKKEFKVPDDYEPDDERVKKIWGAFLKAVPELLSYRVEKENPFDYHQRLVSYTQQRNCLLSQSRTF
jgi:hypothetical protein